MTNTNRKCCITCGKPLISFQKVYLHPEEPCSGLMDYIDIEATISDEFLHDKFEKLYGKPDKSDYELLAEYEKKLNHPLVRFLLRLIK